MGDYPSARGYTSPILAVVPPIWDKGTPLEQVTLGQVVLLAVCLLQFPIAGLYCFLFFLTEVIVPTATATLNFPGTATMGGTFTEAMNDRTSTEFRQVQSDFCSQVRTVWISANLVLLYNIIH